MMVTRSQVTWSPWNCVENSRTMSSYSMCYDLVTLELIKEESLILELTQENLIESSVQDCLPYIPQTTGLCTT